MHFCLKILGHFFIVFMTTALVSADQFKIGGQSVNIPSPEGFHLVTPEMEGVYLFYTQMEDSINDQIGLYIEDNVLEESIAGGMPDLERYCMVKVNKKLKNAKISSKDFIEFRERAQLEYKEYSKSILDKVKSDSVRSAGNISEEFDVELSLELSDVAFFPPHYKSDNEVSSSMYIKGKTQINDEIIEDVIAATYLGVNAGGKVIFLYCYANKDELEWTRDATKEWSTAILSSNPTPPADSSEGGKAINSSAKQSFFDNIISGGVVGVLVVIAFAVFTNIFRKNKK